MIGVLDKGLFFQSHRKFETYRCDYITIMVIIDQFRPDCLCGIYFTAVNLCRLAKLHEDYKVGGGGGGGHACMAGNG